LGLPLQADLNAFVPHLAQQFTEMLQQHGALPGGTGGGRGGAGAGRGGGPATGGPSWDALRSIVATVANAIGPAVAAAASSQVRNSAYLLSVCGRCRWYHVWPIM